MKICMVMVMDPNRLIGSNGRMPWHIPSELQYFKSVTMGKPIIMGRKTWESIGRPLPGRTNIVVSSQSGFAPNGAIVTRSLQSALDEAKGYLPTPQKGQEEAQQEVMVIGGAALCREAMPLTERLYLTELEQVFDGDTWLDSYIAEEWQEVSRDERVVDGYLLTYRVLERLT